MEQRKAKNLYKALLVITHKRVFVSQNYFTHDYLRLYPIVLVTNIIITLNTVNYFTSTFVKDIFDWIVSTPLHIKERTVFLLNLHGLSTNIRAFWLTFWEFWAFWNYKRKIETHLKNEICNRNPDLPCWRPRIYLKTLFWLHSLKVETKN